MAAQVLLMTLLVAALSPVPPSEAAVTGPKKLPAFIRRCSLKDPMLNQCALQNGREVVPRIVKGDSSLHLPVLDPLSVPEIRVHTGTRPSTLDMVSRNIVVTGLANANLRDIDIDLKNKVYSATCEIPRVQVQGEYEVEGRVLVLPIRGNGKANFTFENVTVVYVQPYTLTKKGNEVYHDLSDSKAKFNCTRAHFHLENLFNGDKVLGENVNNFLNENWKEVISDLADPFVEATAQIIQQIAAAIASSVPYSDIFLDTE